MWPNEYWLPIVVPMRLNEVQLIWHDAGLGSHNNREPGGAA